MITNLENIHEMSKILSENNHVSGNIITMFVKFGISQSLRRLGMEKQQGVSAVHLIISLCLFRINGESVFSMYCKRFCNLLPLGKNCFYRLLNRCTMDWRTLLLRMSLRFFAILRKENAEESDQPRCYIIDDTTLEKTGPSIEGVSRVYNHVVHKYVLGFKALILAYFDGRSTIPVDFSLHREKGKNRRYGLSDEERHGQYRKKRREGNADSIRFAELDQKKASVAISMMRRAWDFGLHAAYALCDSWFTSEEFIRQVREIGDGSVHFLGMAKMNRQKYRVRGMNRNAYELISCYEREAKRIPKYKSRYFQLNGLMGDEYVRIFFIKYGMSHNWNIIITTDTSMKVEKCFETYQIRWNIEVLNKECKQYLGLGGYLGRDFDGQIADCTLCFMTYTIMALEKRLNDYETLGGIFRSQREDLLALTLWRRILEIVRRILCALAELTGVTPDDIIEKIVCDEKALGKYMLMIEALEKLDKAA